MVDSDFVVSKVIDSIFDPEISEILAEMETESKHFSILTEKFQITSKELEEKLSYLIEHGFVTKSGEENDVVYSVNSEKLSDIMENGNDYKNIEDNLAKMDSFLN